MGLAVAAMPAFGRGRLAAGDEDGEELRLQECRSIVADFAKGG